MKARYQEVDYKKLISHEAAAQRLNNQNNPQDTYN